MLTIRCRRYAHCMNDTRDRCACEVRQHYQCKIMQPSFIFYWLQFLFFFKHTHALLQRIHAIIALLWRFYRVNKRLARASALFLVCCHMSTKKNIPTLLLYCATASDIVFSNLIWHLIKCVNPLFKRFLNYLLFIFYFKILFSPFH